MPLRVRPALDSPDFGLVARAAFSSSKRARRRAVDYTYKISFLVFMHLHLLRLRFRFLVPALQFFLAHPNPQRPASFCR